MLKSKVNAQIVQDSHHSKVAFRQSKMTCIDFMREKRCMHKILLHVLITKEVQLQSVTLFSKREAYVLKRKILKCNIPLQNLYLIGNGVTKHI